MNKKILIFIDYYLPGFKSGGPVKSVSNIVEYLEDEFSFFIITRDRDLGDTSAYADIKLNSWQKINNNSKVFYLDNKNINLNFISSLISEINPDIIYLNSLFSTYFTIVPLVLNKLKFKKKIILCPRGMLGEGALKIKLFKKKTYLIFSKLIGLFSNITWQATSNEEKQEITKEFNSKSVIILENLSSPIYDSFEKRNKSTGNCNFYFLSRISPKKNLHYFLEILSQLDAGNITFNIIGPDEDREYWQKCKELIRKLPKNITCNYLGALDINQQRKIIKEQHFFVLTTLHENYGHAIFEALSASCPVILSDNTFWRNLSKNKAGWDLNLTDRNSWIVVLNECIKMDQNQYQEYSLGAYQLSLQNFNNKKLKELYKASLNSL